MPPWLLVVPLPRYDNSCAIITPERSRRHPAHARPCPRRTGAASRTRSGEGRRAAACASALAIRTPVPSITRVGLKIVARLRLPAPAVLDGLRAVWRVRGPPRRGVMIRRPRPCRCFGGPKSTAVLVNDLGRTLKNAATSRETSVPHLVRAGVGLSKYLAVMPALGEVFAPAAPAGGAGTSSEIFHSLGGWTMVGVDGAAVVSRGGRRLGPHVGRKEALVEGPRRRWRQWCPMAKKKDDGRPRALLALRHGLTKSIFTRSRSNSDTNRPWTWSGGGYGQISRMASLKASLQNDHS